MKTAIQSSVVLLLLLVMTPVAEAQMQYFGYFGSDYIGSCGGQCADEFTAHSNVEWHYSDTPAGFTSKIVTAAAAPRYDKSILNIAGLFFNGHALVANYSTVAANLEAAIEQASVGGQTVDLTSHVAALYLKDEPLWQHYSSWDRAARDVSSPGGATITSGELAEYTSQRDSLVSEIASLAGELESRFPTIPRAVVFAVPEFDANAPYYLGAIDQHFDWLGFDCYTDQGTFESCGGISIGGYVGGLKNLMTPSQRLILVPPGFTFRDYLEGDSPSGPTSGELEALRVFTEKYWELAKQESTVIGIFPYVWASYNERDVAVGYDRYYWAVRSFSTTQGELGDVFKLMGEQILALTASSPAMFVDAPGSYASVPRSFHVGGWAIDQASITGTGIDTIHIWATPPVGSAVHLGTASLGGSRPDVQSAYSHARFLSSGFGFNASMPSVLGSGNFKLTVFAHSSVTGSFSNAVERWVTIPSSHALMSVDTPTASATVNSGFVVAGWAIDKNTPSAYGVGVDAVHAWAYPVGGGSPIFVGAAALGGSRPDVATAHGAQFNDSGFSLTTSALSPGQYDIVVYARSVLTLTFNNEVTRRVTVQ
ncbi:MAG: hypothetical protein AMXMBFR57_37050 [Acidimicrobiia bacterium]